MLTRTECTDAVALHARRIEHAIQLGWLYDAWATATQPVVLREIGWLTRAITRERPARRARSVVSALAGDIDVMQRPMSWSPDATCDFETSRRRDVDMNRAPQ